MSEQTVASAVWMIRPARFFSNSETAITNHFQFPDDEKDVTQDARKEFDGVVSALRNEGVDVIITESQNLQTPDAVFPNNWISFHSDGEVVLYPMQAESRRAERDIGIPSEINSRYNIRKSTDFSQEEMNGRYLEGTGSLVFDHRNKKAYACISPRTDIMLAEKVCAHLGYEAVTFHATDSSGLSVYHTNVM